MKILSAENKMQTLRTMILMAVLSATILGVPGLQAQTEDNGTSSSSATQAGFLAKAAFYPVKPVRNAFEWAGTKERAEPNASAPPPDPTPTPCDDTSNTVECRRRVDITAYTGMAIDTFAADEVKKYLNPGASGDIQYRGIFGFDFEARLMGSDTKATEFKRNLWLYGETLHGVRSADIDCKAHPDFPTCQDALALPTTLPQQTVFMLRNATTLEGYFGFRWEFLQLKPISTPINLYLKGQAGFISVSGNPRLADAHHVAFGLTIPKGDLTGSYLEAGFGRTDLFLTNKRRRFKIDGYFQKQIKDTAFSFFAQMLVDTDLGQGSDAVQSYIGFNTDVQCLFDLKFTKCKADSK
jgi:hypothetical protein